MQNFFRIAQIVSERIYHLISLIKYNFLTEIREKIQKVTFQPILRQIGPEKTKN